MGLVAEEGSEAGLKPQPHTHTHRKRENGMDREEGKDFRIQSFSVVRKLRVVKEGESRAKRGRAKVTRSGRAEGRDEE